MRVLITGASGQVGTEAILQAPSFGIEAVGMARHQMDLANPASIHDAFDELDVDGVINAAAYTAVDRAETEPALAKAINGEAVEGLAQICGARQIPLVHYSTDYVFDGTARTPLTEDMSTAPLGVYGHSKRRGEVAVLGSSAPHAIIRLAWVFSAHGKNFLKTMLRLGAEHGAVRVVDDQVGTPTPARAAAAAGLISLKAIADNHSFSGLYHYAGDEAASWADFAEEIFAAANMNVPVTRIGTTDFPTPAKRPTYSVLSSEKFEKTFGLPAANWRNAVRQTVNQLHSAQA